MTKYRVVNPLMTNLNDGSTMGQFPSAELDVVWHGEQYPDSDELDRISADLRPVQLRDKFKNIAVWEGYRQPGADELMAAQAAVPVGTEYLRRRHPMANLKDALRRPELRIQRQRSIKWLGWKTLASMPVEFREQASAEAATVTDSEFFDTVFEENLGLFFSGNKKGEISHTTSLRKRLGIIALVVSGVWGANALLYLAVGNQSAGTTPSIELNALPTTLPSAIKQYIGNVGLLYGSIYKTRSLDYGDFPPTPIEDYQASGIVLSPQLILTAGHAVVPNTYGPKVDPRNQCVDLFFVTSDFGADIKEDFGTFNSKPTTKVPDAGILRTYAPNWTNPPYIKLPRLMLYSGKLKVGEPLFFVNYEPKADGSDRDPINPEDGPAIYGGIYEGQTDYGDYDVITGLKSYGEVFDNSSRGGSSGGAVFNARGELVGISVRLSENPDSIKSYENQWGVNLKGLKPNQKISDTIVQPVNKSLIDKIMLGLKPAFAACETSR